MRASWSPFPKPEATRGPLSRAWLQEHKGLSGPEIYGAPALLLPRLAAGRFQATGEIDHVFVPNLNDLRHGVAFDLPEGVELVSPMQSWARVVDRIVRAKFVSSTSLHGLVIAEAYGIPARYVRLSEEEKLFKYEDYYAGSGRARFEAAPSVADAVKMGGEAPISFDPEALISAFPWDLWELD